MRACVRACPRWLGAGASPALGGLACSLPGSCRCVEPGAAGRGRRRWVRGCGLLWWVPAALPRCSRAAREDRGAGAVFGDTVSCLSLGCVSGLRVSLYGVCRGLQPGRGGLARTKTVWSLAVREQENRQFIPPGPGSSSETRPPSQVVFTPVAESERPLGCNCVWWCCGAAFGFCW